MVSSDLSGDSVVRTAAQFATTHWSVVLAAADSASPGAQEALEKLCQTYWYPLYAFVRLKGHPPEDAQDLTQAFFERFLEKHYVKNFAPEKGRFRTFLLTILQRFLCDQFDRSTAAKRGGGVAFISVRHRRGRGPVASAAASRAKPGGGFRAGLGRHRGPHQPGAAPDAIRGGGQGALFEELRVYFSRPADRAAYSATGGRLGHECRCGGHGGGPVATTVSSDGPGRGGQHGRHPGGDRR